jgi:hypothetical protein
MSRRHQAFMGHKEHWIADFECSIKLGNTGGFRNIHFLQMQMKSTVQYCLLFYFFHQQLS